MAALYAKSAFVFVENDSEDDSKARLLKWLGSRPTGTLLELDGLAATEPTRTARLAYARNAYLGHLRESPYIDYDDLVILDLDDVNATPLDLTAYAAAADFLQVDEETVGVFANSRPVYFDIWALRHPTWCPNDCWAEVRANRDSWTASVERFIYERQIAIDSHQPPLGVESAFGGLGIYRLRKVLPHQYVGTTSSGTDVCEHVSLNLELSRSGQLFIFPALQNLAPQAHLRPRRLLTRELRLEQDNRHCVLLAPPEHRLDVYRAANPLYDRRLPLLARLVGAAAPGCVIIDVGANIGDTVALCRMAGCDAPFIAVEPSPQYFALLEENRKALPSLFKNVHALRAFIGAGTEHLSLVAGAGTAHVQINYRTANPDTASDTPTLPLSQVTEQEVSLIKIDTDGYDAIILSASVEFLRRARPVIWAEAEVSDPADEQRWSQLCTDLAESHPHMCIFDNFGFLVAHGAVADKQITFLDLLRYTRRHKAGEVKQIGPPRIYYIDVAFFPATRFDIYTAFINALIESAL
jgi:FkbM family methyltransferase